MRPTAILKNNGQLTKGPEEVLGSWYQPFRKVLNVQSIYDDEVIAAMPALEPMLHLDNHPSMEKLEAASSRLKPRKAGGLSGILPELILCGGPILCVKLLTLMRLYGEKVKCFRIERMLLLSLYPRRVTSDHVIIGEDLVCFIDVAGKVLGRIIQDRLQVIAEPLVACRLTMWISERRRLCGHDFYALAANGDGKRTWGLYLPT